MYNLYKFSNISTNEISESIMNHNEEDAWIEFSNICYISINMAKKYYFVS